MGFGVLIDNKIKGLMTLLSMWVGYIMYNRAWLYDIGYLHGKNKLYVYKMKWGINLASYCEMAWYKDECHGNSYVWSYEAYMVNGKQAKVKDRGMTVLEFWMVSKYGKLVMNKRDIKVTWRHDLNWISLLMLNQS